MKLTYSIRRSIRQRNLFGMLLEADELGNPLTKKQLATLDRISRAHSSMFWRMVDKSQKRRLRRYRKMDKRVLKSTEG